MLEHRAVAFAACLAGLAGCASTPPKAPPVDPLPVVTAFRHADDATAPASTVPLRWWTVFSDPVLDALVDRADTAHAGIQLAQARLAQARAGVRAADAQRQPQLNLGIDASRQAGPLVNAAGASGSLLRAGVSGGVEVDLFGRLTDAGEAARRDVEQAEAQLRGARLAAQAEVAQAYLRLRGLDLERALARRLVQAHAQTLAMVEQRLAAGSVAELDQVRARTEWLAARADLTALDRRRAEAVNALAPLVGEPASLFTLPEEAAWALRPPEVPAGIPSAVLARRPDVQAAWQAIRAAQSREGQAHAAALPALLLTGAGGQASQTLGSLLSAAMRTWSVAAMLSLPLVDGGRREADQARARAEVEAREASYRATLLTVFREVEDQLVALQGLRDEARLQTQAVGASSRATELAERRWNSGLASQLELLQARRTEWTARRLLAQLQAAQGEATVGLLKALGGGWEVPAS